MANFYFYADGQKKGPVDASQLRELAKTGAITETTILELDDGRQYRAEKVNGLAFKKSEPQTPTFSPPPQSVPVGFVVPQPVQPVESPESVSPSSPQPSTISPTRPRSKKCQIPPRFFEFAVKRLEIIRIIVWFLYGLVVVPSFFIYLSVLYAWVKAENPFEAAIAFQMVLWGFLAGVIPAILVALFIHTFFLLFINRVRLMGKWNELLDRQLSE